MDDSFNIILSLQYEDQLSNLKTKIYDEELKEINSKYPIIKDSIDIKQTYYVINNETLEVGFFIRNAMGEKISLEDIDLSIMDNNKKVIITKRFDFKEYGVIMPYSARHFIMNFELEEDINLDKEQQYTLNFSRVNDFQIFSSVPTEIENIPIDMPFEEERDLNKFVISLPTLQKDEIIATPYKLSYNNDMSIVCTILLRNGMDKEIEFKDIHISIINELDEIIAKKVFFTEEQVEKFIRISPRKSKLVTLIFNSVELPAEKYDLSNCKIMFK